MNETFAARGSTVNCSCFLSHCGSIRPPSPPITIEYFLRTKAKMNTNNQREQRPVNKAIWDRVRPVAFEHAEQDFKNEDKTNFNEVIDRAVGLYLRHKRLQKELEYLRKERGKIVTRNNGTQCDEADFNISGSIPYDSAIH